MKTVFISIEIVLAIIVIAFLLWTMLVDAWTKMMKEYGDTGDLVYLYVNEKKSLAEIIEIDENDITVEVRGVEYKLTFDDVYPVIGYPYKLNNY